ncbi:hypothetical protein A2U01_0066720, partial [Trifolium medium]|nr:hypothetical protein [Trifolium medium]
IETPAVLHRRWLVPSASSLSQPVGRVASKSTESSGLLSPPQPFSASRLKVSSLG